MKWSALTVSEYPIVRGAVRTVLGQFDEVGMIADAGGRFEGVSIALQNQPNLTLLDEPLEGHRAPTLIPSMREVAPETSVILLTLFTGPHDAAAAFRAGASAYISKARVHSDLVLAVRAVMSGDRYASAPFEVPPLH